LRKIEDNPIWQQFQTAKHLLLGVFEYRNPTGVILTGPPGLGKSYLVRELAREFRQKWNPIRPSASKLVQIIFEKRTGGTLVFDDFDDMFDNEKTLQIFKIVLDSHAERILSHDVRGKYHIPPFRVDAGAIFISNRNFSDPEDFSPKVWRTQIPALKSRTYVLSLSFDPADCLHYTRWVAPQMLSQVKIRDHRGYDRFLPQNVQKEILAHFDEHATRYPEMSPRTIEKYARLRITMPDRQRWLDCIEGQLLAA
jgi:hypothetical protein